MFLPRIKTALAVAGVAAALPAAATAAHHHRLGGEEPTVYTYGYNGGTDVVTAPASASAVCIVAKGGDGAGFTDSSYDHTGGGGAVISGCLPVTSRDTLLVAPGGAGHMANTRGASDSLGGWGYEGAQGGGGHLGTGADGSTPGFPSGGGGGATVVQLNGQDIIIAAGGGGQGGGGNDEADGGSGGSAGPVAQSGGTASNGSVPGGAGGAAPGPAGGPGLPSPWSDQFASYSWGGGGGGGVNGGGGAVGSQFAGPDVDTGGNGGGAGSSMIDTQAIHGTIETGTPGQNLDGTVTLTFVPQLTYQLTPSASSVTAGETVTVPLTGTTSDGQSFPLGVSGFTWSTKITPTQGDIGTAPDKVAGDQITMYQAGVHTVTAYLNGTAVASAQVSVTAAATKSAGASADPAEVTAGHSAAFQVTAYDAYGNPTGDLTTGVKLTSDVASDVVNGAHVKFVAAGTHTITATIDGYKAMTTVQVDPAAAVSATLAALDSGTTVDSGVTVYLELTGEDAYGNQFTLGPSQFTLTDSGFGDSIDGNTIQFGQAGQRTITAYLTGTTVTAQLGMTVLPGPVSSLKLAPSATTITAGQSVTVDVTGLDASGDSLGPIDPSGVAMILSPTTGVAVAGNEFTFADPGTYYINAYLKSDESVIGNTVITVNPATETGAPAPVPTSSHRHYTWRCRHERRPHAARNRAA